MLAEWKIAQEGQIDAGRPGEIVVNRVRVLVELVGEHQPRQRNICRNGDVDFGFAKGRNHNGMIVDPACNLLSADMQFGVQPQHRQRAIIGILNVEFDSEFLL